MAMALAFIDGRAVRRERIAARAMQGLLANSYKSFGSGSVPDLALKAVACADALMCELDRVVEPAADSTNLEAR